MAEVITHKRGATFEAGCLHEDGGPVDLTSVTITSQVRTAGGRFVGDLAVTKGNQGTAPGTFTVRAEAAATALWPLATLIWDIRYQTAGGVAYTETAEILVVRQATEAAP